jgi:hypothetical protein
MRYMLLLYVSDRPEPGTPEAAEFYPPIAEFYEECHERGVLVAADPLHRPETATTVRVRDGKALNIDGPFAETAEWLGGYFMLECGDLDEALKVAARHPTAKSGSVEVRPVWEVSGPGGPVELTEVADT